VTALARCGHGKQERVRVRKGGACTRENPISMSIRDQQCILLRPSGLGDSHSDKPLGSRVSHGRVLATKDKAKEFVVLALIHCSRSCNPFCQMVWLSSPLLRNYSRSAKCPSESNKTFPRICKAYHGHRYGKFVSFSAPLTYTAHAPLYGTRVWWDGVTSNQKPMINRFDRGRWFEDLV
jgi:hypothetical protein